MGKVASRLTKPVRLFNIENRARRALDKQDVQAVAAPKHPSTIEHISHSQQETKEHFTEGQQKNEALHEKLKGLYVERDHTPQEIKSSHRPLPESRKANPETDLGIMDTFHTIPEGRANLKTVLHFIGQHQVDPSNVTVQSIADDYKLDKEEVEKVLYYFKAFNLHIPQEMYKQNKNLKKIVADQINSASNTVAQLQLSLPKEDSNSNDTNTNSNKV